MSKVKTFAMTSVLAASMVASTAALADASANIGVVSDYVWRGTTQTNGDSAIQGGLDYSHSSGLSVGTWVSNTAFGSSELDLYGAYSGSAGDFGYTVSAIQYRYPQDDTLNWVEYALGGSYKNFSLTYNYSSDVFGSSTKAGYLDASASFDVAKDTSVGVHVGHYKFDDQTVWDSYTDYSLSLSKGDFTFTASDTNLPSGYFDSDPKFFVSWGKSFDL